MNLRGLIDELKQSIDLVDVMEATGVEFKSKLGTAWRANCFDHEEREPSLIVTPKKGLYNCFSTGCVIKGDVVSFYQQWHKLGPVDAAKRLADEYGIDTSSYFKMTDEEKKHSRLMRIMEAVTKELHKKLKSKAGEAARAHLKKRRVNAATAEAYQLGFSPSCGVAQAAARKAGASDADMDALQLDRASLYDGKIVYPVICPRRRGHFHYASGVGKHRGTGPKYIGPSSAHALRWKGPMFGLQVARESARDKGGVILVEGQYDALTMHSAGFTNTVCMLGSNPTPLQFENFKQLVIRRVTVLFDSDGAGEAGIAKVVENGGGFTARVAFIPEDDPDVYLQAHGKSAVESVLEMAISPIEYLIHQSIDDFQAGDLEAKSERMRILLKAIKALNPWEIAIAESEIAKLADISPEIVHDLVALESTGDLTSTEQERSVLAGSLQKMELFTMAEIRVVGADVWSVSAHRHLWEVIRRLRTAGVRKFTLDLLSKEIPEDVAKQIKVDVLLAEDVSNFEYNLDMLTDVSMRRLLQRTCERLKTTVTDKTRPVSDLVSKHLAEIAASASGTAKLEFTAPQQVDAAMKFIHTAMERKGELPGINMGKRWPQIMTATLGWQEHYMYIVTALPKKGKTAMGLNWALESAVEHNVPTTWFNLEMSERDLALRNLAILSGVSALRMRSGQITKKEKSLVDDAALRYHASPLTIVNAAGMTVHELVNSMRKSVYTDGTKLMFLDYIQLVRAGGNAPGWEKHQEISTALKSAMANLPVPLIALSQLNKSGLEGGGSENIGGSFKYIQDCDVAMSLRERSNKEMVADGNGNRVLEIDFNRHGPQGVYTKLMFNTDNLRCEEVG